MLLGALDRLVYRHLVGREGGLALERLVRKRAVVTPPHVPRGVPDEHAEQARRLPGLLHERTRLRQEEERLERLLDGVERVLGAEPLLPGNGCEPARVDPRKLRDPPDE